MNGFQICKYLWAGVYALWLVWALRTKPARIKETIISRLSHVLPVVAAFILMFTRYAGNSWLWAHVFPDELWVNLLGILLTFAGLAFAFWARVRLGGNWSSSVTVKVGHELVRTGPYRWVRHPIYSGLVLAMSGTAMANGEVRGVIAVVLVFIGFTIKSRIEERAMIDTFGAEYEDYRRSTGGILPKLH